MLGSLLKNLRGLAALLLFVSAGQCSTGYFIGLRGDFLSTTTVDKSKSFWDQEKVKTTPKGATLFTGYMYAPFGIALSGQIYMGFKTQGDFPSGTSGNVTRHHVLWNRWNAGAELLVGKSLAIVTVYGLAGGRVSFMQMRGSSVKKDSSTEILFYGKAKETIENVSFNKQQPPRNLVLNWTLGGGIRVALARGLFVGFEARYAFGNTRPLYMKVTKAVDGSTSSVQKTKETFTLGKGPVYSALLGITL